MRALSAFVVLSGLAIAQDAAPQFKPPEASRNVKVDPNRLAQRLLKDAVKAKKGSRSGECSIPLTEVKPVSPPVKMPLLKPSRDLDARMVVPPPAPPCEREAR